MKILNTGFARIIHFFFPAYCLHCDEKVKWPTHLLCRDCFQLIEWIDRKERCTSCWGPRKCKRCFPLHPHRSLFEETGPIASLYFEFCKTKRAKLLASLIVIALSNTSWETFDLVVPLIKRPIPKEDSSYFLAKEVGKLLGIPSAFPSEKVEGKKILFLVPYLASAHQLFKEKKRLGGFFPAKVYTLALIDQRS